METIYTTLHPETGELTKETEFVNSWKWNDDRKGYKHGTQQQRALIDKYHLPQDTPVSAMEMIVELRESKDRHIKEILRSSRRNEEFLNALEVAAFKEKDLVKTQKTTKKKVKDFLLSIDSYLHHHDHCLVTTMKIVGRAKTKSKCNCGLSKTLSSIKI